MFASAEDAVEGGWIGTEGAAEEEEVGEIMESWSGWVEWALILFGFGLEALRCKMASGMGGGPCK